MTQLARGIPRSQRVKWTQSVNVTRTIGHGVLYFLLVAGAAFSVGPFLWSISGSLMSEAEIAAYPPKVLPRIPQWENYRLVWTMVPFGNWVMNSLIVTTLSLIGTLISASLVAYAFARFRFPGRDVWFILMLSTIMLPYEVTIIPHYLLFRALGWLDSFKPLIVPSYFGGGAFSIFLLRQFLLTIPRELDEAAYVDGASSWTIFWRILIPLIKPALATLAVIQFMAQWNSFIAPLIYLNTVEKYTIAVGIRFFQVSPVDALTKDHLLLGASLIMIAPILILFVVAQRYFVRGIALTGIKG
jgi:multiple sugar transport system permease protein